MNNHVKSILLGASLAASHTAFASDDTQLPAITVIVPGQTLKDGQRAGTLATGSNGSIMDVPFSVTSVDGDRVRDQAGTTLQDALRNVPGAQADSGFNGSHTQFFILRGAVSDSGTGSNRVLRDGVRLSNYPYVPAFVESIDVLRGPGSAIGVRSEPGGTVNIVTRQPLMENGGSVLLSAGEHSAREYTVDLNRVLSAEDQLAARIIATRSTASEWRHVPDELNGLKFGIAKSDGGRYHLRAGIEATNQVYQPDYGIPAFNGGPVDVPLDRQLGEPFGNSTTNNRIVDLHGDVALTGDTRFAADITHLEAHSTSIKNLLNGAPLAGQPAGTYARISAWEPDTQRRIDTLATSLTSRQTFGDYAHSLFFGLDYYKETLDQPALSVPAATSPGINVYAPIYGLVTPPPAGATLARSLTTQDLKAVSASAQDQIDIGAWSAIAGVRYTDQDFVYGAAGVRPVKESRWSPKFGLLYRPSGRQTLYANVASGTSPNQVASSSNQSLPSRKATQAELGWKSLWLNDALACDVALYHLKQTNMISADQSTPLNNFDFTVGGSARSQGVESSLTGFVGEHLNLAATYAYTDAVYLQNSVYGGKRVPNVARQTLTLWGQYRWDDAWKTGAGLYVQGERFADEANTTTLPGYGRVDLTQTWTRRLAQGGAVEVQLALRNAFDQRYFVSSHLHVSRWIMPGEGRNVNLTATYRF
jgi:iron complex outermembrane receptor protein